MHIEPRFRVDIKAIGGGFVGILGGGDFPAAGKTKDASGQNRDQPLTTIGLRQIPRCADV